MTSLCHKNNTPEAIAAFRGKPHLVVLAVLRGPPRARSVAPCVLPPRPRQRAAVRLDRSLAGRWFDPPGLIVLCQPVRAADRIHLLEPTAVPGRRDASPPFILTRSGTAIVFRSHPKLALLGAGADKGSHSAWSSQRGVAGTLRMPFRWTSSCAMSLLAPFGTTLEPQSGMSSGNSRTQDQN